MLSATLSYFTLTLYLSHNVKVTPPNDNDNRLHLHDTFH